ncbi:Gamma-tubulin complex component [Lachnellula hyalina]|uniref:Spindle pole body component n=1 Tax=Lachnellula hyalina TaxID=1316788 RepID=A0A8H8TYG5_9HELO|nr:Gamma-tubulin complex component [Lachnellula hyalina]TVY25360.1 Gamma-tubulin complex component [Lachnellula hyalina]
MSDDEGNIGIPFAIPDLWGLSKLHALEGDQDGSLFSQIKLDDVDQILPDVVEQRAQDDNGFFSIPDLSLGLAADVPTPPEPTDFQEEPVTTQKEDIAEEFDFWSLTDDVPLKVANYQSWDGFDNAKLQERQTPYITEAGPGILDAALAAKADFFHVDNTDYMVLGTEVYTASLLALGLGRSSVLFAWDETEQCFSPTLPDIRISGHTGESLNELSAMFMECGNITRALQSFFDKSYGGSTSAGRIALADAVSTLLATIQSRLSASTYMHNSLLQLQALFQPAYSILTCFRRIVTNVSVTRSDEAMLSTIFQEIQLLEHRTDSLQNILLEILSRVSQPWLEFSGEWLGLQREAGVSLTKEGNGKSFVRVEKKEWVDEQGLEVNQPDFVLDFDKVPTFLAPEDARAMFEVGRSLRFLRDHHSDHPLARADIVASANPPSLEWKFSWKDIMQVEEKALQYEKDLTTALLEFSESARPLNTSSHTGNTTEDTFKLDFFGRPEEDMQAHVLASIDTLNQPLGSSTIPDRLSQELSTYLTSNGERPQDDDSMFLPPISLTPLLSFNPIISAQARIVNGTCMRMFFNTHNLREHLDLQRSFHLLGNGVFSSRLSHALFDPELESAERQRGVARSGGIMGLRLGGRDTWPPASSELRLALMGVLTDSYISNKTSNRANSGTYLDQTSLPGDLSFAVRDMAEEEIEKCKNLDSVEALDFLRLSYKPPPPLEAVITPMILFKYDQLFKLLLRVIRMLYVVSALFRDATDRTSYWQGIDFVAQRFRIEAHHFIYSLSGYFFDTGIESTWRIFDRKLDQIERRINSDSNNITLGQNEGLDKLREYHEKVLDRIMFALLLRKRQQPVMKLLEEIFTLILQFAAHSRERALGLQRKVGADEEVRELYLRYRKKVGVFITVCRGLSEKKGYGEKRVAGGKAAGLFDGEDLTEENTVAQLLARLEMSNYYSRSVDV